ncbi:MAG: hypothetical protein ACT4O2_04780 [Beijerinckiaceae bacterium]
MTQDRISNASSEAASKHIALAPATRETLAPLIMRRGMICPWRVAAHVATAATVNSARRRFYRFFQHAELHVATTARIIADLPGGAGQRFRQAKPGKMAGGGMRGKAGSWQWIEPMGVRQDHHLRVAGAHRWQA